MKKEKEAERMLDFKEKLYAKQIPTGKYVLAGDIGGTHANFGILSGARPKLYLSLHFKSEEITDFAAVVQDVVHYVKKNHGITITSACFAAAGVISKETLCLTNRHFCLDLNEIKRKTKISSLRLINDFQAISYGLPFLHTKDLLHIKSGKIAAKAAKAIIGAGTGLGKGFLIYNPEQKMYCAYPSEGGHSDAVSVGKEEEALFSFLRKETGKEIIEWEDLVSGKGIVHLYNFVGHVKTYKKTKYSLEIKNAKEPQIPISKYKHLDSRSRDAFKLFLRFYARCAKNLAFDVLPFGGMYLAGGIAAANPESFKDNVFQKEFLRSAKHRMLLQDIPLFLIKNYNVSLYGAALAAQKRGAFP